jgi:hypothetical protein
MEELFNQVAKELTGRLQGPFAFRLIIQPVVAAILGVRAGLKDVREGRPAHGWAIVADAARRRQLLQESWKDVAKVFVAGFIIDLIYEIIAYGRIYPGHSLIIATTLALFPYLLTRGPVNRIAKRWRHAHKSP